MKYLVVLLALFFCTLQTFGQQDYFIYLQTDNNQAFYLRFNNTVYSSASSGYLVLSKLPDSTAIVTIGFPNNVFPEQQFNIPVNHKDAAYLVKNFGDKGWGLFNLQTMAVIMNSNPPREKKSPEISGIRKNDAFSLLLANAVNDTAVLYAVSKPPKPVPPPVIVTVEEKKKDTASLTKDHLPPKDSNTTAKNQPAKNGNNATAKNTAKPQKGKPPPPNTRSSATKGSGVKISKPVKASKTAIPVVIAKNTPQQKKDTIIIISGNQPPATAKEMAAEKNKKERKDTIIMMNGTPPGNGKPVAVSTVPEKDNKAAAEPKKDTANAPVNTAAGKATGTKDSSSPPPRRTRPLVTKAAEILTDTSYVAVYVDESKDKFDTIRISIPFNEIITSTKEEKPAIKEPIVRDTMNTDKIKKDSSPVTMAEQPAPVIKSNAGIAAAIVKDIPGVTEPQAPAAVKKDSLAPVPADSSREIKTAQQALTVNADCKEITTDSDIDKLRIQMLLVISDEDRIGLAKKLFKQKCLLVKQVRALSELFKSDEGKYKWFDGVYPYVSDGGNFSSLGELIKDDYYQKRFKALLRF